MTQNCLQIVNWLKSWFYDKDEIDTELSSKQDTLTWTQISSSGGTTVWSNGQMVKVEFQKSGVTANAWSVISTSDVPEGYRPHTNIRAFVNSASSNTSTMFLGTNGKITTINALSNFGVGNVFYYAKY